MYQLTMSTIHDTVALQYKDSDSCVGGIPDLPTALTAAVAYMTRLKRELRIEFTVSGALESPSVPFAVWGAIPNSEAVVYIEVQRTKIRTDANEIVEAMRTHARFSHVERA